MKTAKLLLLRHGRSSWNDKNLFTGWVDVPLSKEGVDEALKAGAKVANIPIDVIFTSTLLRAQMTAALAMMGHSSKKTPVLQHFGKGKESTWSQLYDVSCTEEIIPMIPAWQLNERMYGTLQGMNKKKTMDTYGESQVKLWRRSYEIVPPSGESLEMTAARTIPYFESAIIPHLEKGENVFVVAHGNSLRSIVMDIEKMGKEEIINYEIATGELIIYHYEAGKFSK